MGTLHYKIEAYGLSDRGLVRQNNEDVWAEISEAKLFVLADGMGGHRAGEVASREAVDCLLDILTNTLLKGKQKKIEEVVFIFGEAIQEVNHCIYQMSRKSGNLKGMGTTLCCIYFFDSYVVYGHVGDSRIYKCRNNQIEQLTKDHSLLSELLEMGQIDRAQVDSFLYKNVLTRAIGTEASVEPSIGYQKIESGDVYLMCTDGLTDVVNNEEIRDNICRNPSIDDVVKRLVELARSRGGPDNITIVGTKVINHEQGDLFR